jgi:uncharacterized protein YqcC (DUF446 family)
MPKSMHLWKNTEIGLSKLLSRAPFCRDILVFEQWLSFIFIPKIYQMINQKQTVPSKIALSPMTQLSFKYLSGKVETLIQYLRQKT